MKTFTYKRNNCLLLLLLAAGLFIAGCDRRGNPPIPCGACFEALQALPNLSFRVVDKVSGKDLFFGSGATYNPSQLKFTHILDGQPDSAYLRVDTPRQYFNLGVPTRHRTDTVLMQITGKPQDILLFQTSLVGQCCPGLVLTSVSFNGSVVYTADHGPKIAVLEE